jgi:hypothetical protein
MSPGDISVLAYGSQPGPMSWAEVKLLAPLPFQMTRVWSDFLTAARSPMLSPLKSPPIGRL